MNNNSSTIMFKMFHLKVLIYLQLFLLLLLFSCQQKKEDAQYNVLFIAVDDLRTELNCYGADHIISPNIDRLASSGVLFTHAHIQESICMASRASIKRGRVSLGVIMASI